MEIKTLEKEVSDMTTHITDCEKTISGLEPENDQLKKDLESLEEQMKKSIAEASENAEEEVRCLKVKPFYSHGIFFEIPCVIPPFRHFFKSFTG